jgi:glutamine synthetase
MPISAGTCASAGNDHRLGANEAPPAIISIFMGEELTAILEKISKGQPIKAKGAQYRMWRGYAARNPHGQYDRNRTSPFAFTGNKFEFRMVGSSQSIAGVNVALNTIAAEALDEIANRLEKAKNKNAEAAAIIKEIYKKHNRIIFNGNNYSEAWVKEAEKRGLSNVKNSVDALNAFITDKALKLFEKYEVLSHKEVHSRYEIYVEAYAKQVNIEGLTAIDMAKKQLIPAAVEYATFLADSISSFQAVSVGATSRGLLKKSAPFGFVLQDLDPPGQPSRRRRALPNRSKRRRPTATRSFP